MGSWDFPSGEVDRPLDFAFAFVVVCFVELAGFAIGDGFAIGLDWACPGEFLVVVPVAYLADKPLAMGIALPSAVVVPFVAVAAAVVAAAAVVLPSVLETPVDP